MVAEIVHQNGVTLHAANRMFDKDTDATEGCMRRLLLIASLGRWILVTLARFLVRYCTLITTVIRLHAQIASIDPNMQICQPIQIGREFLLQHAVIMIMPAKCAPKKDDAFVRERPDGVLPRMAVFLPL